MIIDSQVQFWRFEQGKFPWLSTDMGILQRDYLPEDLSLAAKRNEINGVIVVQTSLTELETMYLTDLAYSNPIIKGVIGRIDLHKNNINEKLIYYSQNMMIKGFNIDFSDRTPLLLNNKDFQYAIGQFSALDYTCDLTISYTQLADILTFLSRFPQQKFVIGNAGLPDIAHKEISEWAFFIREIAKHPNACCKLSGLFTLASWAQWNVADFYPYLDILFEAFGTSRLLYASDWPKILLSGSYIQWKSLLENYMKDFSENDRQRVFGLNALRFYNLNE